MDFMFFIEIDPKLNVFFLTYIIQTLNNLNSFHHLPARILLTQFGEWRGVLTGSEVIT